MVKQAKGCGGEVTVDTIIVEFVKREDQAIKDIQAAQNKTGRTRQGKKKNRTSKEEERSNLFKPIATRGKLDKGHAEAERINKARLKQQQKARQGDNKFFDDMEKDAEQFVADTENEGSRLFRK